MSEINILLVIIARADVMNNFPPIGSSDNIIHP